MQRISSTNSFWLLGKVSARKDKSCFQYVIGRVCGCAMARKEKHYSKGVFMYLVRFAFLSWVIEFPLVFTCSVGVYLSRSHQIIPDDPR